MFAENSANSDWIRPSLAVTSPKNACASDKAVLVTWSIWADSLCALCISTWISVIAPCNNSISSSSSHLIAEKISVLLVSETSVKSPLTILLVNILIKMVI